MTKTMIGWVSTLALLMATVASAQGASLCSDCHGMPPIDAPYRNITTGGFRGSHMTHNPSVAVPGNCEPCHTGSSSYVSGHADGIVKIAANINNSPLTGTYSKGVFFNQTSVPVMGTCANVNCHFEAVSPAWASAPLVSPAGCSVCHSNPPSDGNHPSITGPGKKHGDYYGTGAGACIKCHPDHTVEAKPFAHATSATHHTIVLRFSAPNTGGSYSKTANLAYPNYLPSQTTAANRNGTCSSLYCHSDGNGGAPATVPTWGSTLAADCTGCHGGAAGSASVIATGKHPAHINNATVLGSNLGCVECHAKTVSANTTIATFANHVNGLKDYSGARAGGSYHYTVSTKSCASVYCHSNGKGTYVNPAAWNSTATLGCNGCHGTSNAYGAPDYANGGAGVLLANSHAKHALSSTDCAKCHTGTTTSGTAIASGSTLHVNGTPDITFNTVAGTGAVWTAATKSCSSTYCHGTTSPVWGGASMPADCTGCHGNDSTSALPIATGKHTAHTNNTAVLGLGDNFGCVECHAKTVSANRTISTPANHVNGMVDYSGARAGGSARYSTTTKQCTNIYCHSNGNPNAIVYANPAAWNSTTTYGCNGCHGTSNATTGAPDYANGGAGTATANSHPRHVAGAGIVDTRGCANCHAKTVSQTTAGALKDYTSASYHLNRTPNISFKTIGGKTGVWNGSTCTNTYCHGAAASAAWGSPSLACNACHSANSVLPGAHAIHYASTTLPGAYGNYSGNVSSASAYRFTCGSCHSAKKGAIHAGGPANANAAAEVFFGMTSATLKGSYTYGTTPAGADNGFNWTAGGAGCNTTYCHSNGRGGNGLVAVAWSTTASTGTCVQCHDTKQTAATATTLSGKHDKHMNPTNNAIMGLGNGFNCKDCHGKTITDAGNLIIADKSKHVNKFIDYSGVRANGSSHYNTATKQCTNIYCHSNGNPGALVFVSMTGSKTWTGTATFGCNSCHGRSTAIGAPDYANGGAATVTANSHTKHVAGAADTTVCATCHVKTANMTVGGRFKDYTAAAYHLNGIPNVVFNTAKAGTTATWTQAGATCSNVACHGGTGSSAVWGATLNCQDCHGNGATASSADFGATFWNNGTMSKFQMTGVGSWAGNGHGLASGTYPGSNNPAAAFGAVTNQCEFCHDSTIGHYQASNPFRLRNYSTAAYGRNAVCLVCHSATGAGVTLGTTTKKRTTSLAIEADHYGAKHTSALSGGQFCWDCHDPHGTGLNTAGTANQYMVRNNPAMVSNAANGAPTTQTATGVVLTLSATPTGTDFAKSAAPFNGICNVCHTTTSHYTTTAGDGHNSGSLCTSCHSHTGSVHGSNAFTPVGGGVSAGGNACFGCHTNFQSDMSIVGATRTSKFHHVLGTSSTDAGDQAPNTGTYPTSNTNVYCVSCHADHNYFNNGGTVATKSNNLRTDIANSSAATTARTDYLTTGTYGICVSCHSASLTKDTTNQLSDGTTATPAISGAAFGTSMHNYTTTSSYGTATFSANCSKCHTSDEAKSKQTSTDKFGTHQSTTRSLLNALGAATYNSAMEDRFCYRCHSQVGNAIGGGGTTKPVNGKDWFASKSMVASAEDTFNSFTTATRVYRHNTQKYSGLHKVVETRADIAASKHVECADCHNPHQATSGDHTARSATLAGVLTGASGVGVTTWGANWAGVTTYNPSTTTAALITATAEWQVCFKCHSGANANVTTWGGTAAAAWTDLALEFNPNNAAGHPVVSALPAARQLTAAKLTGGWTPGSIMTCSDCHATDSTASKGPHGSSVKWMLAGTNKAWPYTSAAANGTSTGTFFRIATYNTGVGTVNGLFCLNCHTVTGTNNWHAQSNITGGQHGSNATGPAVCVNCHVRVPHGGKISRLLQTTNAPARYKNNGNGATSLYANWGTSTVNIKGSTFSNANFKSSCSEHSSGGTGGEAW